MIVLEWGIDESWQQGESVSDQQSVELHKKGHGLVLARDREGMAALVAESSDWHIAGH